MRKPITGVKTTAAIQDTSSAVTTTTKIEKVYSPAAERAKPTGMNPAAVTSVPVSIGKAAVVYAKLAARVRSHPCSILITIISVEMIASSTSRPSAMMSAPSEMRCSATPKISMKRKVTASTSGIDSATTMPGAQPEAHEAHAEHDHERLQQRLHELVHGALDHLRLVGHLVDFDAHRQARLHRRHRALEVRAQREHVAAACHRDREPDRRFAPIAHLRGRRIDVATVDVRDVAEPEEPAVGANADLAQALDRFEIAADANVDAVARRVSTLPEGTTAFCARSVLKMSSGSTSSVASFLCESSM